MRVVGTDSVKYKSWRSMRSGGINNGAYWYAKEIEDIILPALDMNLYVITAGSTLHKANEVPNDALVICHSNDKPRNSYMHLFHKNILWVCSKPSTVLIMQSYGEKAVYVPLSIDTEYVKQFKTKKTREIAFVGNAWGYKSDYLASLPKDVHQLTNLPRDQLLTEMAKYKTVIADGRCNIEAQVLGCKVQLPKYDKFETIEREVVDSRDAIPYWQEALKGYSQPRVFLKALRVFNDLEENRSRNLHDVFSVKPDRANELLASKHNLVELLT